jgi:hypothetical protein
VIAAGRAGSRRRRALRIAAIVLTIIAATPIAIGMLLSALAGDRR